MQPTAPGSAGLAHVGEASFGELAPQPLQFLAPLAPHAPMVAAHRVTLGRPYGRSISRAWCASVRECTCECPTSRSPPPVASPNDNPCRPPPLRCSPGSRPRSRSTAPAPRSRPTSRCRCDRPSRSSADNTKSGFQIHHMHRPCMRCVSCRLSSGRFGCPDRFRRDPIFVRNLFVFAVFVEPPQFLRRSGSSMPSSAARPRRYAFQSSPLFAPHDALHGRVGFEHGRIDGHRLAGQQFLFGGQLEHEHEHRLVHFQRGRPA